MTQPNILLVVLDATRADACSCYGAARPTTPSLDALAAEGTLYEQAISPAPWTLPAFASLFTGFFPNQLGIYERRQLPRSVPTLASLLAQAGYATFGITGNSWMGDSFGLQQGFDRYHKLWQLFQTSPGVLRPDELPLLSRATEQFRTPSLLSQWTRGNPVKNLVNAAYNRLWAYRRDYGASRTAGPLLTWLKEQRRPWFAFVHYLEAHLEFKPPLAWARRFARDWDQARRLLRRDQVRLAWRHSTGVERLSVEDLAALRDLYLAEVAYADSYLGVLIDALAEEGQLDKTVVMVTADHGESLGEQGLMSHQFGVHDPLIRVPLVVRHPELFPVGERVAGQVQTLDLFATALEIAGAEVPACPSQSLVGDIGEGRPFTVAEYGPPRIPHSSQLRRFGLSIEDMARVQRGFTALRSDEYKLVVASDGAVALYNWRMDQDEEEDLAHRRPKVVEALQALLLYWQKEQGKFLPGEAEEELEMDPSTAARLRALGYIE